MQKFRNPLPGTLLKRGIKTFGFAGKEVSEPQVLIWQAVYGKQTRRVLTLCSLAENH